MNSPETTADELPENDECRAMHVLRSHPELFEKIAQFDGTELALQKWLRVDYPAELVAAAIGLHELRKKAAVKFSRFEQMWFDRVGLEQATSESVARHKAARFSGEIYDLCAGIGGDTIALAEHGSVTAVDLNPAACLRTLWNAAAYDRADSVKVRCDDVTQIALGDALVHLDPDRRPGSGGRVVRLEDAVPDLDFLQQLMQKSRGGAIKLSPAANFIGKFPDAEMELISLAGECKEATAWFGELATPGIWRATVLPSGETLAGNPLDAWTEVGSLGRYVYDPDPGIVRSGLIDLLAREKEFVRLDDTEEYLTSQTLVDSSFVRPFEVLDVLPYHDKALRKYFREANFGQLEIKCRHIRVPIESLRKKLSLTGTEPGVLIVARIAGETKSLICKRL